MIKILILQQLYDLADGTLEYQLLDRRSFPRFLNLTESSSIPDAKTIWLFRDRLAQAGVGIEVFEQVQQQLLSQGYLRTYLSRQREIDGDAWQARARREKAAWRATQRRATPPPFGRRLSNNLERLVFLKEGGVAPL